MSTATSPRSSAMASSGPASWYLNADANAAYAQRAQVNWRSRMPVLFLHGAYDYVCETLQSRLAEPMRAHAPQLKEMIVPSGHWMAQEQPLAVNAALAKWLATEFPGYGSARARARHTAPRDLYPGENGKRSDVPRW